MKHPTKIFMAVAVLFASFACTTDATEDLGVKVGGQTTLTISLEESRTQLGEKAGDAYPLYWSAGDQISVNGTISSALSVGGNVSASFTFDGTLGYPYNVLYPANAEGKVVFPASQEYVAGTFANGAVPMYGYATSAGETIQMNYLAGLLRFDVSGEVVLSSLSVESTNGYLAGTYTIDCANGTLAAVQGTTSDVVTLSFGDGLALGATATPIYVAVPAGNYGEVVVRLNTTNNEQMVVKFDSSEKAVSAGRVREFTPFEFFSNSTDNTVIIDSKEALLAFAANPTTSARVTANIDMTGVDWTPIEGFTKTFDGGNFEIKGLNAPLFGTISPEVVRNVHLVDVDIKAVNKLHTGAVVEWIQPTSGSVIKNCSASGKIVVDYDSTDKTGVCVGGVIGRYSSSEEMNGLTNRVDIEINGTYLAAVAVGGVSAAAGGDVKNCTNLGTTIVNATCKGDLYYSGVVRYCNGMENCICGSKDDATGETGKIVLNSSHEGVVAVGGIVHNAGASLVNCHNYANIYYNGSSTNNKEKSGTQFCGLVYYNRNNNVEYTGCSNHGDIIVSGSSAVSFILGGFSTIHFNNTTYRDCHNYGDIIVKAEATTPRVFAGGLIGTFEDTGEVCYIKDCSNRGNISVFTSSATTAYLGGMCGKLEAGQLLMSEVDNADDINENYGNILYDAKNSGANVYIGGSVGILCDNLTYGVTKVVSAHRITYFTNYGDITVNGECKSVQLGGFIGRYAKGTGKGTSLSYALVESCNKGNLTVNAAVKGGDCAIGGMMGFHIHSFSTAKGNWVNEGKMTFTGSVEGGRLLIGGYMAATDKALSGANYTVYNFGDIEVTGTVDATMNNRIGGVFGQMNRTFANCHTYCNIVAVNHKHVGMLTGCDRSSTVNGTGCSVGGTICLSGDEADETLIVVPLDSSNYFNYMYGGLEATTWGETAYDGCVLLTAKPNL